MTAPPDTPVCVEIHMSKGYCVNTISSQEQVVDDTHKLDGKTWWDHRPTMILVPATSWAKLKAYIIKTCKTSGQCDQSITNWHRTVEKIDNNLKGK